MLYLKALQWTEKYFFLPITQDGHCKEKWPIFILMKRNKSSKCEHTGVLYFYDILLRWTWGKEAIKSDPGEKVTDHLTPES